MDRTRGGYTHGLPAQPLTVPTSPPRGRIADCGADLQQPGQRWCCSQWRLGSTGRGRRTAHAQHKTALRICMYIELLLTRPTEAHRQRYREASASPRLREQACLDFTMSKGGPAPDLKKYMDKKLSIKLNANRHVIGTLRGFDQFMNIVLDNTVEEKSSHEKVDIGMVVIRGNSVVSMEALERV